MARIKISDLTPTGSNLFQDSESFLDELTNDEIGNIKGCDRLWLRGFLRLLRQLSVSRNSGVSFGNSIQTVFSNTVNRNSIGGNTMITQTINAQTVSNINTMPQ